jgi:hypothetical protein
VFLGIGWLSVAQYCAAKKRSRERRKEGVRAKVLALAPEQRSHLSELAGRGEICLSDDDVEDQIDAALRCVFVTVFWCASDPAPELAVNPETGLFGANRGEAFTPIVPAGVAMAICDNEAAGEDLTAQEAQVAVAYCRR